MLGARGVRQSQRGNLGGGSIGSTPPMLMTVNGRPPTVFTVWMVNRTVWRSLPLELLAETGVLLSGFRKLAFGSLGPYVPVSQGLAFDLKQPLRICLVLARLVPFLLHQLQQGAG